MSRSEEEFNPENIRLLLSHPTRQRILGLLLLLGGDETLSAGEASSALGLAPARTAYHFRRLRDAKVAYVKDKRPVRNATELLYAADPRVAALPWIESAVQMDGSP